MEYNNFVLASYAFEIYDYGDLPAWHQIFEIDMYSLFSRHEGLIRKQMKSTRGTGESHE